MNNSRTLRINQNIMSYSEFSCELIQGPSLEVPPNSYSFILYQLPVRIGHIHLSQVHYTCMCIMHIHHMDILYVKWPTMDVKLRCCVQSGSQAQLRFVPPTPRLDYIILQLCGQIRANMQLPSYQLCTYTRIIWLESA